MPPAIELVVALETSDRIRLAMAKSLQVPRDCEAEARELLEQLLQPVGPDAAEAES